MLDKLHAKGLTGSKMEYGVSLDWLKTQTDNGKPVICSVIGDYGPGESPAGHIVVVTGVNSDGTVIINDPASGTEVHISGETFMKANSGRMAIAASE